MANDQADQGLLRGDPDASQTHDENSKSKATFDEQAYKMLEYIREHLVKPLTRQELASAFNLTPGYINQLFKAELGMSPSAVINRERLARAYQMIDREGYSVKESAFAVGFKDPLYFTRVFRRVYELSPSQIVSQKHRMQQRSRTV